MLPPRSGVTDSQQDIGSVVNWPWQAAQLEQYMVTFLFFFGVCICCKFGIYKSE